MRGAGTWREQQWPKKTMPLHDEIRWKWTSAFRDVRRDGICRNSCLCFIAATERCPLWISAGFCQPSLWVVSHPLPLCSHQHEEAERSCHGGAGRVQPVLHAAVAVRPVCAAHSGKTRGGGADNPREPEPEERWLGAQSVAPPSGLCG